jgi:hypothetical protein
MLVFRALESHGGDSRLRNRVQLLPSGFRCRPVGSARNPNVLRFPESRILNSAVNDPLVFLQSGSGGSPQNCLALWMEFIETASA